MNKNSIAIEKIKSCLCFTCKARDGQFVVMFNCIEVNCGYRVKLRRIKNKKCNSYIDARKSFLWTEPRDYIQGGME